MKISTCVEALCVLINEKQKKKICFWLFIHSNSIPPTTSLVNFCEKLQAATGQCFVDTAFWGGVIPGNQVLSDPLHITQFCNSCVEQE